jgi:ApbE superfamily uncharacterized protein (UPF0280 family)
LTVSKPQKRFYRNLGQPSDLKSFRVVVKETDLHIHAESDLTVRASEIVAQYRGYIEGYIRRHPIFLESLVPISIDDPAPSIVSEMILAAKIAGVGPMAAVAGAIAANVGRDLLSHTSQVIVENGGDVFAKTHQPLLMGIYAGSSPLSLNIGLRLECDNDPVGICTSSGTVGHSLSKGKADAVCVVSPNCILADAAATAIGNVIQSPTDISPAIEFGRTITGVSGLVIIVGDRIGCWGKVALEPIRPKKG